MTKSPLDELGEPFFYVAGNAADAGFPTPPNPLGQSMRTWVRALGGMQKEALVVSAATGTAWRLASDEGPDLGGINQAPNPLTFLSAGMIASYMNEITALAQQRGITLTNLELILDNYYYREGSFRKGTMNSAALPSELEVICDADCDDNILKTLLFEAVSASPLNGLASGVHPSLFALVHNGKTLAPEQVTPLPSEPFADPGDNFPNLQRADEANIADLPFEEMMSEDDAVVEFAKNPRKSSDLGSGKELLHMHTKCVLRPDGIKEIFKEQYGYPAPTWQFLSDEAVGFGGQGRAPDAATLISAGIGLCFMTQMGRFANMAKLPLTGYRIVQDTHFSLGGASGGTGKAGVAKPVETHVYLDSVATDSDAQQILGIGEHTCFLHAFCRAENKTKVRVTSA